MFHKKTLTKADTAEYEPLSIQRTSEDTVKMWRRYYYYYSNC